MLSREDEAAIDRVEEEFRFQSSALSLDIHTVCALAHQAATSAEREVVEAAIEYYRKGDNMGQGAVAMDFGIAVRALLAARDGENGES